jgi:hypothetical protein
MIMFGGGYCGVINDVCNETWEYNYNTNTWTNLSPTVVGGSLPRVATGRMVYDSGADRIILLGGNYPTPIYYNETWVYCYSNNTWWKRNPDFVGSTFPKRTMHGMVYDSGADRTIVFGGDSGNMFNDNLNDTWVYDYTGNTWYKVSYSMVGGSLYRMEAMGMVYDSVSDKTILACGWIDKSASNTYFDNDTWVFSSDEPIATITWTTDEPSDSVIHYGTTTALGNTLSDNAMITNHQILLTGLLPDTTYYYEVQSTDASNNKATDNNNGNYYTFTTEQDTTPPIISNVASSEITYNSGKITWDTDEPSNSKVIYGTTTPPTGTKSDSSLVTSHSITLTNLLSETTYYYEVQSIDQDGNTATDNNDGSYYTLITETIPNNVMHVYSIDMWYQKTGKNYNIYTKVKIVDSSDNPVNGATVYIETTLPDHSKISNNGITGSDGTVTFMYGSTKQTGTYTSTVTNVVKDGWIYNSYLNVETSEQLQVP